MCIRDSVYILGDRKDEQKSGALVRFFKSEMDLLQEFLRFWIDLKPTIISGWNIDQFDTPYLYNRIKNLLGKRQANRLSPIGECFWSPYRKRFFMAGVSYLDYLALYKNFTYT